MYYILHIICYLFSILEARSKDPFFAAEWDGVLGLAQSLSDHAEFNVVQNLLQGLGPELGVSNKQGPIMVYSL